MFKSLQPVPVERILPCCQGGTSQESYAEAGTLRSSGNGSPAWVGVFTGGGSSVRPPFDGGWWCVCRYGDFASFAMRIWIK